MNSKLVILSLLELGLAILLGVIALYVAYSILMEVVFKKYDIKKDNLAFAILVSAILFSVGNIMEGTVEPISDLIRQLSSAYESLTEVVINSFKYVLMFLAIAVVLAFLINFISIKLFITLTKVDEFAEISANNISPAIVTGAIAIIISLFAKGPAVQLMQALIPYPDLPGIL
ncbi:MAG: hypothetical protein ACI85I_000152 [Arenicella sp.]|jgi:hypothetical protein